MPTANDKPIFLAEIQFQPKEDFYSEFLAEIFLYLNQYRPIQDWQASGCVPSPPVEPLYVLGLFRAACCTPAARLSWRPISAYWAGCHFRSHFWAKVIGPQGTQSFYLASFWLRPITPCRATLCSGLVLGRLLCFRGPFELAANIGL